MGNKNHKRFLDAVSISCILLGPNQSPYDSDPQHFRFRIAADVVLDLAGKCCDRVDFGLKNFGFHVSIHTASDPQSK